MSWSAASPRRRGPRTSTAWVVWTALTVWGALWACIMARHGGVSWHYFDTGGLALVDLDNPAGSIHVYATHPELQFGPVAMAAAAVLSLLGNEIGLVAAQVLGAAAGLVILALIADAASTLRPLGSGLRRRHRLVWAGAVFLPVWMNLSVRFVHIDDVLALLLVSGAVWCAVRRQPTAAGILLGLSAASKPWALPFLVLLLVLPRPARWRAILAAGGTVVAAWSPFLLADPRSILVARFTIPAAPGSSLPTLGISDPVTPGWDRPVQLLVGAAVAAVAVRRGRWQAGVLLVVGIRIVLDPGSYSYYTAGVLVGALLWDLLGSPVRFPVWSWAAAALLFAARWLPLAPGTLAWVRTLFVLSCVALLVLPAARARRPQQRTILRPPEAGVGAGAGPRLTVAVRTAP